MLALYGFCQDRWVMASSNEALFETSRRQFHSVLAQKVLRLNDAVMSNADKASKVSKQIALGIGKENWRHKIRQRNRRADGG